MSNLLKFILLVILFGVFAIIFFNKNPEMFYDIRAFLNQNEFSIITKNDIEISKVNVFWSSDFKAGQIIKNGKETDLTYKEYGPNKFTIVYEKDTLGKFIYFKTNNWHGHKHKLSISLMARFSKSVTRLTKDLQSDLKGILRSHTLYFQTLA